MTQLAKAGGINGYPDGTFRPKNTITRADIAVILVRVYLRYMNDLGKIDLPITVRDEAEQVIIGNGLDHFFPAVLTELKKMKAAYDKYPEGFLKEMAKKKGSRTAEIILCPYTFEGFQSYGRYVYDYSSDAKKADQVYYTGVGDTHYYSHEMGHMVYSAVGILNGWNATEAAWKNMMTGDWDSYISNYAVVSMQEDQAAHRGSGESRRSIKPKEFVRCVMKQENH